MQPHAAAPVSLTLAPPQAAGLWTCEPEGGIPLFSHVLFGGIYPRMDYAASYLYCIYS